MNEASKYTQFLLYTSLLIFLLGSITKISVPLAEWDHVSLCAAEDWAKGINKAWVFDHPPLYPFFLTALFKLFGPSVEIARLGNMSSVLITAIVLFRLASQLFNRDTAAWAVFFYLLSPVCIQGTSSMDMADTSLLPLLFILTASAIKNNTLNPGLKNTCVLTLCIGMCFWAKVSSSITLIAGLILGCLACFLIEKHRNPSRSWILNMTGILSGTLLFLISWSVVSYCFWGYRSTLAVFKALLLAVGSNYDQHEFVLSLLHKGYDSIRVFVWFSPYVVMVWLIVGFKTLIAARMGSETNTYNNKVKVLLACLTFFYFVGHLVVGGTNWGFPRYHIAILPLVCMFVGAYIARLLAGMDRKVLGMASITVLSLIVLYVMLGKDPLLFLNLELKKMMLYNYEMKSIAKEALITFVPLYGMPVICTLVLFRLLRVGIRGKAFAICLFMGSLSTVISLDVQQILAIYRTTNQYGAVGKREVVQKIRDYVKHGESVFSTPEIIYALKDKGVPHVGLQEWINEDTFHDFLQSKDPKVIVSGLTLHTVGQLRWLLGQDIKEFLSKNYRFEIIGTYFLWFKTADR